MSWKSLPPTVEPSPGRQPSALVVIREGNVSHYPLPVEGRLVIGRAEECEVYIPEPSISRAHAALYVNAEGIEVEDLGSANGTRVREVKLDPGIRTRIAPGEAVHVGQAILLIQGTASKNTFSRPASHAYFEARVEEELRRAATAVLAVLRIHLEGSAKPDVDPRSTLAGAFGGAELIACYAPGEYEALFLETTRERAAMLAERIEAALDAGNLPARVGIACSPIDGATADALFAKACAAALGSSSGELVVEDPVMRDLHKMAEMVSKGTISVLILGETGVGKEIFAQAIHASSPRKQARLLRLNCAAFNEHLIESELFGHEKGAFTGADKAKVGLLELAAGGTVFLDEVGELPLSTQAKLLRAVEEGKVMRVGATEPIAIDVRFVAATNRDLEEEITHGAFRRDLYYRLNGVSIVIPPLRERPTELARLAKLFVERVSIDLGRAPPVLSERALELLARYEWPGNIRELRNVIERAVLLATGGSIDVEHLPIDKLSARWSAPVTSTDTEQAAAHNEGERRRIQEALEACAGNQSRAAELLGISRRTLIKRLDAYGTARPRKAPRGRSLS